MPTLRTEETENIYVEKCRNREIDFCPLCPKLSLESFKHWKLVENDFPYDRIADAHHMLVPKRHVRENELSFEELEELKEIKEKFVHKGNGRHEYDYILEASNRKKTVPDHFHLHLIVLKD